MSTYSQYKTDKSAETKGVDLVFEGFTIKAARAGGSNKKYTKALERASRPYRRAIANGSMSEEVSNKILMDVYAETVILGWEEVTDEQGKELTFNRANVIKLFTDLPELFKEVVQLCQDSSNFLAALRESSAKNS